MVTRRLPGESPWFDGSRDGDYVATLFAGYVAEKRHGEAEDVGSARDNDAAAELLQSHPELSEQELRQRAAYLIEQYWCEIEAVATALMADTTLQGEEVEIICDAIEEHEDWRRILTEYRKRMQQFGRAGIIAACGRRVAPAVDSLARFGTPTP